MEMDGSCCGVAVDIREGRITHGTVLEITGIEAGWLATGGNLVAHWTVEAGAVPEFLRDPWLNGYIDAKAKIAVFCQRKIDARRIETELRRRIFRQ